MKLPYPFNPAEQPPNDPGGAAFPISDEGGHLVKILESSIEGTKKDKNSGMLVFKIQIIDGPYSGTVGFYRLNLYHATSEQAKEIAAREFTALHYVLGYAQGVEDTNMLHDRPFRVVVKAQKDDQTRTDIKGVLHADGRKPSECVPGAGAPAQQAPVQQQTQAAPPPPPPPPAQNPPPPPAQSPSQGPGQAPPPPPPAQQGDAAAAGGPATGGKPSWLQ